MFSVKRGIGMEIYIYIFKGKKKTKSGCLKKLQKVCKNKSYKTKFCMVNLIDKFKYQK